MRMHILAVSLFGLIARLTGAEPVDQSLLDLPGVVKVAIQHEAAGHSIAAIEHSVSDGHSFYQVRIVQDGLDKRMVLASDGTVVEMRDFAAVNHAIASGTEASKQAWDKTKEVATNSWQATKETVRKAVDAFRSDELTLNQVPPVPRMALERSADGDRITDIHAVSEAHGVIYRATFRAADGRTRTVSVAEDGTPVTNPP